MIDDTEICNNNGLQVYACHMDWACYIIKTSKYSVVVCERYGEHCWDITAICKDSKKEIFSVNSEKMPQFMNPLYGKNVRELTSEEEVNAIIDRMSNLGVFL